MVGTVENHIRKLFDLTGKKALVTGGSKGIGKAIASLFSQAGAKVLISSRNENELKTTSDEIGKISGNEVKYLVQDHSKWHEMGVFANNVRSELGHVDILCNNAGTGLIRSIEDMKDDEWEYIISLNLSTPMVLSRAFIPSMKKNKWGRIINSSSLFGVIGKENRAAYCSSKGGLLSFTKAMAIELAFHQITVNAIGAGPIKTPLTKDSWNDPVKRQKFADMVPMKRWGEPEEIAGIVLMLASDAGSYITGQIILADGGASAE